LLLNDIKLKSYSTRVIDILYLDDEKFIFRPELKLENARKFGYENAKDIIACGFDLDKSFIFSNTDYVGFVSIFNVNQKRSFFFYHYI